MRTVLLSVVTPALLAASCGAAQTDGVRPLALSVRSQPLTAGQPAVSLTPDGQTFGSLFAYEPADVLAAYGVDQLHAEGLLGEGQTIVVVDSFGSPTALEDLQTFSNQRYGFPLPGSATTAGYDLTTGRGSPKAHAFVHDLADLVP